MHHSLVIYAWLLNFQHIIRGFDSYQLIWCTGWKGAFDWKMEAPETVLPPLKIPVVTTFRHTHGREHSRRARTLVGQYFERGKYHLILCARQRTVPASQALRNGWLQNSVKRYIHPFSSTNNLMTQLPNDLWSYALALCFRAGPTFLWTAYVPLKIPII